MKKLLITIFLLSVCAVYAQTDERQTLKQLNQNAVSLYKSKKYDEAIKVAQQALELTRSVNGAESRETAVAYANLGIIYRARGKYKSSVENLQKAADIYQKISGLKGIEAIEAYQSLGYSQFLDGEKTEAEASYFKSLEISQAKFGKESKENFSPTLNLAVFYDRSKNFDKGDEFYLKAYAIAIKNFDRESKEFEQIDDSRICLRDGQKSSKEKEKLFEEAKTKLYKEAYPKKPEEETTGKSEVINGKAVSLPRPVYSAEAKEQRLSGTASVKVKIDEQGNVIEAKSICRTDELGEASEKAALQSKFSPTLLNGTPVKVTGIIVYNFILDK